MSEQHKPIEQLRSLLEGKKILIAGYGREGKSSEALIRRLLPEQKYLVAQNNEEIYAHLEQSKPDMVLKSPGIPTFVFEGRCDLDIITSQTDLFLQVFGPQTIGVTGTKGKTTTTNLIYHILSLDEGRKVVMAGNMGIPLFDVIPQIDEQTTVVCEFSCHQLENIHRGPHVGVVLNLFQEHLDHYHDYRDYQMAKMQIALRQRGEDYFFFCSDNGELVSRMNECAGSIASQVHSYSLAEALHGRWADVPRQLQGDHNMGNIHVAAEMAMCAGVKAEVVEEGIRSFHGLEHRLELVGTFGGITFYNDSICTIPQACMEAIKALGKVDTLILGGFDRGIDYAGLTSFLEKEECGVRNLVFVGAAGKRMAEKMNLEGRAYLMENDYAKIVKWCFEHTAEGKICLLSPAAASYDAFKNFEERGRVYKELVKTY